MGIAPLAVALSAAAPAPALAASAWSVQPTINPAAPSLLLGVSCPGLRACSAVGWSLVGAAPATLAERWNGSRWAIQPTVAPPGGAFSGVSCSSATACIAVGSYLTTASGTVVAYPLAERWNGLAWRMQSVPLPSGETSGNFSGVSCTSASACTAVGTSGNNGGPDLTLVERWNGSKWAVQPTPNPAGAVDGDLRAVSCASATACTAVGTYQTTGSDNLTLAEGWDGASWTIQPMPDAGSTVYTELNGVSCTSASACTAVGTNGSDLPLAERWDGTSWTVQSVPSPPGEQNVPLNGVSCATASACTAVGNYNNPGVSGPTALAEHWDGATWTIQTVPSPPQATGSQLFGVSCTSASVCTGVGLYYDGSTDNETSTLVERYS